MSKDNSARCQTKDGRWTKEEHQKFLIGVQIYGKNWKEISKLVGTRSGSQIRSHAQKHFDRTQKVEKKTRVMAAQENESGLEEESSASRSYFFSQISRLSMEVSQFKFWDHLIGKEGNNFSAGSEIRQQKLKVSFTPYTVGPLTVTNE